MVLWADFRFRSVWHRKCELLPVCGPRLECELVLSWHLHGDTRGAINLFCSRMRQNSARTRERMARMARPVTRWGYIVLCSFLLMCSFRLGSTSVSVDSPCRGFFLFISVHVNDSFVKVIERLMCRISSLTDFIQHLSPERDLVSIFDIMCHLKCFSSSSLVCTRMYSEIHAPLFGVITWFCFSDLACVIRIPFLKRF